MKIEEGGLGVRVIYIPNHAHGDRNHPDCERGVVTSVNSELIFVRFDQDVERLGWKGSTSKSCRPENIVPE